MKEKILACTSKGQLISLLMQVKSREELYGIAREYGIRYAWMQFWSKKKLVEYLACEIFTRKPRKSEYMTLSLSGATLAGMMIFMLVL